MSALNFDLGLFGVKNECNYFEKYKNIQNKDDLLTKFDNIEILINFLGNASREWLVENRSLADGILNRITLQKTEGCLKEQQFLRIASLLNLRLLPNPVTPVIIEFPDQTQFVCDRSALTSRSAYFRSLFSVDMKEAQNNLLRVQCDGHILALTKLIFQYISNSNLISRVQFEHKIQNELDSIIGKIVDYKSAEEMNEQEIYAVIDLLKDLQQKNIHEWDCPELKKLLQQVASKYIKQLQEYNFSDALAAAFEYNVYIKELIENLKEHFREKVIIEAKNDGKYIDVVFMHSSEEILKEYQMIFSVIPADIKIEVSFQNTLNPTKKVIELSIHKNEASIVLNSVDENALFLVNAILVTFPAVVSLKLAIPMEAKATPEAVVKMMEHFPKIKRLNLAMDESHDLRQVFSHVPSSLEELTLYWGGEKLPILPPNLKTLTLVSGRYSILPQLPENLEFLEVNGCNWLIKLPAIPDRLKGLRLVQCAKVEYLPKSLAHLERLYLRQNNGLKRLPYQLPQNLIFLGVYNCDDFSVLPTLPDSLLELEIEGTQVDHLPNRPLSLQSLLFNGYSYSQADFNTSFQY